MTLTHLSGTSSTSASQSHTRYSHSLLPHLARAGRQSRTGLGTRKVRNGVGRARRPPYRALRAPGAQPSSFDAVLPTRGDVSQRIRALSEGTPRFTQGDSMWNGITGGRSYDGRDEAGG